jgi:hypothetical protein
MFKKLFLGGLSMLLVLGLALSATPAFAQSTGPGTGPIITPVPLKLATITNIFMKLTFPPQMVINGTLPSACYVPQVLTKVNPANPNGSVPTISIFVQAMSKPGAICTQALKSFSTSVNMDARTLKVAPGKYLVLVNPVNGASRFQTTLVIH